MQYHPPTHAGDVPHDPSALTSSLTLLALPLVSLLLVASLTAWSTLALLVVLAGVATACVAGLAVRSAHATHRPRHAGSRLRARRPSPRRGGH